MNAKQFQKLGFETKEQLEAFLDREDVKTMIGEKKYDHYRDLWLSNFSSSVLGEPKKKIEGKFNWLALAATPIVWYAYRRMYALVFSLCGVFAALSFIDLYLGVSTTTGMFVVLFLLIFLSKNLYLGHLKKCTEKIDAMSSQEQRDRFLRLRKGTNAPLAVITTLFLTAVMAYVSYVMAVELQLAMQEAGLSTSGFVYPIY